MTNLAAIANALPGVTEGIACAGTSLESRTWKVNEKAFLFVSKKEARLKLESSIAEARKLGVAVGANGWAKFALDAPPPAVVLKRWIAESHAAMGGGAKAPTGAKSKRAK